MGSYPYHRGVHVIAQVILEAFADESGINAQAKYFVMAGYVAAPADWESFNDAWSAALGEHGVEEFHAKEFFGRRGDYKAWSDAQCDAFLEALLRVIEGSALFTIGSVLDVAAFRGLTYGERRYLTGGIWNGHTFTRAGTPNQPWFVGLQSFVTSASMRTKAGGVVSFVFDLQDQISPLAATTFQDIRAIYGAQHGNKIGDIVFGSRKQRVGLQAADLVTHSLFSFFTRYFELRGRRKVAAERLVVRRPARKVTILNRAGLERSFKSHLTPDERTLIQRHAPRAKRGQQAPADTGL